MRASEREALRQRFQFRCGYCGVSEQDAGAELTVDHFQPGSRGGLDESENWVYCCHACNEFKGDFWQPDSTKRILHPIREDVKAHLTEQIDGTLVANNNTAAFHIERLNLNRPQLVAFRLERRLSQAARDTQADLLKRLQELENQLQSLTEQIERLEKGDPK
jgi:HNH endonuclease